MTQHSLTTRLDHYINTMLPETHGHQRKAFRDFVAALAKLSEHAAELAWG